jgi:predicted N-formylglutamate amidohydrolase
MSDTPLTIAKTEGKGDAPVLVVCEHASNHFPVSFGDLGLDDTVRSSHIAWDPGALELAHCLSERLGATLIHATVSRLLYDLNRTPEAVDAIPVRSEATDIPGNIGLSADARGERMNAIYLPWRAALSEALAKTGARAVLTVHSFTPVYAGRKRDTRVGILHDTDSRLADAVLLQHGEGHNQWHRNRPYGPQDGVTHTLRIVQSENLAPLMIEVRNDLLHSAAEVSAIADELVPHLKAALRELDVVGIEVRT